MLYILFLFSWLIIQLTQKIAPKNRMESFQFSVDKSFDGSSIKSSMSHSPLKCDLNQKIFEQTTTTVLPNHSANQK